MSHQRRYGYIDKTGKLVIELSGYRDVGSFSEGLAQVWSVQKGWGFISKTGDVQIEPQFQDVLGFWEGLAAIKIDGLWGFIDRAGNVVIRPEYESVNRFSEGMAVVVRGTPKTPSEPPPAGPRHLVQVKKNIERVTAISSASDPLNINPAEQKQILVIDKTGHTILSRRQNEAVQIKYDEDARFSEGLIEAFDVKSHCFGFVDKTCKFIVPPDYEQVSRFSEGLARVSILEDEEEKIGFIDRSGRFVIPPKFNTDADFRNSSDFSDGLAALTEGLRPTVTERKKFAYINKAGSIELPTDFDEAFPFQEGLALVNDEKNEKWGFIDKAGRMAIIPQFEFARGFSEGLAAVSFAP